LCACCVTSVCGVFDIRLGARRRVLVLWTSRVLRVFRRKVPMCLSVLCAPIELVLEAERGRGEERLERTDASVASPRLLVQPPDVLSAEKLVACRLELDDPRSLVWSGAVSCVACRACDSVTVVNWGARWEHLLRYHSAARHQQPTSHFSHLYSCCADQTFVQGLSGPAWSC
jgi:hypothetical protein